MLFSFANSFEFCKLLMFSCFLFQMPVCHLTLPSRVTGVMWHTGSTGHGWAASIRCTNLPSAYSMTYLKARASVSAS